MNLNPTTINPLPSVNTNIDKNYTKQSGPCLDCEAQIKEIKNKDDLDYLMKAKKEFQTDDMVLEFSIHEKTNDVLVKLVNRQTGEIVKEIPSEKIVDLIAFMCEKAGLIVDKKI